MRRWRALMLMSLLSCAPLLAVRGRGAGLNGVRAGVGGAESTVRSNVLFAKFNLGFDRLCVF
ncbi:hypothetical protein CBW21_00565 [Chromobacterium violaceum]|uniref:Uncharacterized protein n=1 Tax=Chromobacterium violaceum TaxID=536 RepID=A0A202BGC2_CHRVL|nr:hypothetical protein CBW21_00565 [Chromobacterium violaceum]